MAVDQGFNSLAHKIDAMSQDLEGQGLRKITNSVALAGKFDVLDEVESDIGPDRRMSNWRLKFNAGYEVTSNTTAVLTPRPIGPWYVLNEGRRGKQEAYPRGRRKRKIYRTPWGLRTATRGKPWRSGKSRGHNTWDNAVKVIERKTPERVHKETLKVIGKHF